MEFRASQVFQGRTMTTDILSTIPNPAQQLRLPGTITASPLRPGDIIATASNTAASRGIRITTKSPFSHVLMYWTAGRTVDATPEGGIREEQLFRKLKGVRIAAVFRHRTATISQCSAAAAWAISQVGKEYDHTGALRLGLIQPSKVSPLTRAAVVIAMNAVLKGQTEEDHSATFFCSELIAKAYEVAGAPLFDTPAHAIGPGSILYTERMVYMGSLHEVG
jgi:hypothetical protein